MDVLSHLRRQTRLALEDLTPRADEYASMVRATQDQKFGDYQINSAMPLAKELGKKPRDVAEQIAERLPNRAEFSSVEVAGPGFLNLKLSDDFLARTGEAQIADPALGIETPGEGKTAVFDYSSPNVAKPMHVGHIRSTIIGDALARLHAALGWKVIRDNHLGDWGTQFGMLIHGWRHFRDEDSVRQSPIGELARLYKLVNERSEKDESVAKAARLETAKLHEGDPENLALWKTFMPWCLEDLGRIYERLGIRFDVQFGESFYQPMLADVVRELIEQGIAEESMGAICVFFRDPAGKLDDAGKPIDRLPPTIIRKADGAFTYATSDLATIRFRAREFRPDLVVYVVDDRQSLHFQQLFDIAARWGIDAGELRHIAFGKITGKDGRPFKTREGGTVGLEPLLDEAVARARRIVDENSSELPESDRERIAEVVGIGAVKYADLSQNRTSDYIFDWDKMISLQGNTAAYLQYAYARNRSIFRKGGIDPAGLAADPPRILLGHPSERALALALLRLPESVALSAADFRPNVLTNYLFELANTYSAFFRDCPVLKAETQALRQSRLGLCEWTARTLRHGLELLGIDAVERM